MKNKYTSLLVLVFGLLGLLVFFYKRNKRVISSSDLQNPENHLHMIKKLSIKGQNLIKKFEGLRLTSYNDGFGNYTIGYGHTKGVTKGQTISQQEADIYFLDDVSVFENYVSSLGLNFTQNQFDAVVSLVYNIGETQFNSSTLLKVFKDDLYHRERISAAWLMWVYAGGSIVKGLENRRKEELSFYFSV